MDNQKKLQYVLNVYVQEKLKELNYRYKQKVGKHLLFCFTGYVLTSIPLFQILVLQIPLGI